MAIVQTNQTNFLGMSFEDRVHAAGHGDEFVALSNQFEAKQIGEDEFYEKLVNLGAIDEEASEYINLY